MLGAAFPVQNHVDRVRTRSAPSIRSLLRAQTDDVHEALHVAAPFAAIAEGRATTVQYGRVLAALWHYHSSLAKVVAAGCRRLGLEDLRRACEQRRTLLEQDLHVLGFAATPQAEPIVTVEDDVWAVGCLYTLVGSMLGGKVIFRQLDYLFATPDGRRFFAGTSQDGLQWRLFCEALETLESGQESLTSLVRGAHFAFAHFASCLDNHR